MSQRSEKLPRRSSNIFINYRREDSPGYAGRLFDRLSDRFPGRVFMDIDRIEPGIDFVDAIEQAVGCCEVLIVVIGREWLNLTDATGRRRLDNPSDFVRLEIAAALERNIRIIPVLVEDAAMPRPEDLPPDLARLTRRHAIELSDVRWAFDVDRLLQAIEGVLQEKAPSALLPVVQAPAVAAPSTPAPVHRRRPRAWLVVFLFVLLALAGGIGSRVDRGLWNPFELEKAGSQVGSWQEGRPASRVEGKTQPAPKSSPSWVGSWIKKGKDAIRNLRGGQAKPGNGAKPKG